MSPIYQIEMGWLRYIPAPETLFDVRSHCPICAFLRILFTVEAYALFGRKPSEVIGSLEGLESFQEYAHRNSLCLIQMLHSLRARSLHRRYFHQTGFKAGEELIHIVRIRKLDGSSRQIDNDYLFSICR